MNAEYEIAARTLQNCSPEEIKLLFYETVTFAALAGTAIGIELYQIWQDGRRRKKELRDHGQYSFFI